MFFKHSSSLKQTLTIHGDPQSANVCLYKVLLMRSSAARIINRYIRTKRTLAKRAGMLARKNKITPRSDTRVVWPRVCLVALTCVWALAGWRFASIRSFCTTCPRARVHILYILVSLIAILW